ncbi:hypothetical protein SAMN05421743_10817 [Thalassobacillus cyri]|uniref:Uncharacterized protein n=1 Tax=Thalassobacillus cyri TaxID=571932 RepID=A0A1H4DWK7_9BACI|nr:hypothetical protein [Thalassobacillus cyri]SEA76582.1 hypothetical protein SAMN05421743_10817 [Thalassobacillus cyri]
MNLKSRIDYLCHINAVTVDQLDIPMEELEMLEKGLIQLPPSSTRYLSGYFDRPVSYFENHNITDQGLHNLLQSLQLALFTGENKKAEETISKIEMYQPISSLHQEMIYHLLLAVYHYQQYMYEHVKWLDDNYLSYFLDKPSDFIKHNKTFDKALFHYLAMRYHYQGQWLESEMYLAELFELTNEQEKSTFISNFHFYLPKGKETVYN